MEVVLYKPSSKKPQPSASESGGSGLVLPEGDNLRRCAHCHKPEVVGLKLKSCSSCRNILYCSGECQKANWPTHKNTCRAGPPAQEHQLAQYGYTSAAAFSRDVRDYIDAHSWAIRNIVMIIRQIWRDTHPNTPIREQPRRIRFRLQCQTSPSNPRKNHNPATRFAVVGTPALCDLDEWIRDFPDWWEQSERGRAELETKYAREQGPDYLGLLSLEYFVPETNACTMDFLPILQPNVIDPDPDLRRLLFSDMICFSLRSMNCGFPLRMSAESRQVGIPGHFVRVEKTWQWKPLFSSWDEYALGEGKGPKDAAYRELDLAISSRVFFHGPMPELMKMQAWYCTM
ncbi:hypothetical protein L226DRAFT_104370 [Lentinus tigrinus ALCF2SS1-7]|uniref:MYND-type domain-containing protein n=1 Tax=Lentinus tigrinus ALCF2SS1-6 TaxID=1328759 RepID=A0A5C2S7J4_9APHY|nr:hypothetical protein L227DRAFT_168128 [Lentinus tigrinus ALCF2SS1-6]RPD73615.1 hypothetical protein L226DRAFT_104370 [Lentinus tigrinus ALCF2SS1-7]